MCKHCENDNDPFGFGESDLDGGATTTKEPTNLDYIVPPKKYACQSCGGTGQWRGGFNRYGSSKCHTCNGRGFFKTSPEERQKARQQYQTSKTRLVEEARAAFNEEYPGLIDELRKLTDWNDFAASLVASFHQYGSLTEKQVAAAQRMLVKLAENRVKREAEKTEKQAVVDLSPIRTMFEAAVASGRKKPTYRAEGLIISRAPDHGRNAGSLYVVLDGSREYQGKIGEDNVYRPVARADASTTQALQVIAENPSEAAVRYGRKTGNCAICGRELTAAESVERGIGPICANNFGL